MNPEREFKFARAGLALASFALALSTGGSAAHAQAWLPDRNYTEGPGIRVGDVELHPGIVVRGGYDTNVFRADGDAQPIEGSAILAVTPHIHVSTLGQQRTVEGEDRADGNRPLPAIAFRGGLSATYFHYFLEDGPKNLEVDTDFGLSILPQRPVNVEIGAGYLRNVRPFTQRVQGDTSGGDYAFNSIAPRIRLNVGSRSQVLTGYIGYAPRITLFESDVFAFLNNVNHSAQLGAAWRFLPNTALVYDAQFDLQAYQEDDAESISPVVFSDNSRFRTRLGINGALTRLLSLRVLAGYTVGIYDEDLLSDFENVIGEAVLSLRFGPAQVDTLSIGYQRDVLPSSMGGWIQTDRGFATFYALVAGTFGFGAQVGAGSVSYGRLLGRLPETNAVAALGQGEETDRKDIRIDGALRAEYRATNWLAFTIDLAVESIITDFEYAAAFQGTGVPDPAEYLTFTGFGGVRAHY